MTQAEKIEHVDKVFRAQRRLTMKYAAIFFLLTLLIPFLSVTSEWWYAKPIIGGLTLNFLVVAILFHVVYWLMGLLYTIQANRLEDRHLALQERSELDDKSLGNSYGDDIDCRDGHSISILS